MNTSTIAEQDFFHAALDAMQAHHLSRQGGDFFAAQPQFKSLIDSTGSVLSAFGAINFLATDGQPAPDILESVKATLTSEHQAVTDAVATGINDAANALKTSKNVSNWDKQLDAQELQAIQASNASIKAAFAKAKQLGTDHPEMQGGILAGMGVVQEIISKFTSLISDMVGKAVEMVSQILDEIMAGINGVIDGFKDAAGGLLGSIF